MPRRPSTTAPREPKRFTALNAAGGINGRKINMIVADDQSSATGDLTATQDLVSKGVFAIINFSPYAFGGYKYLQQHGIPITEAHSTVPNGDTAQHQHVLLQRRSRPHYPANTGQGLFFKSLGATNVAGLAYGVSPSSTPASRT